MRTLQILSVLFILVYAAKGIQIQSDKQIRNINLWVLKQRGGILEDYDLNAINNLTYKNKNLNNIRNEPVIDKKETISGNNKKRQIHQVQSKQLNIPQGIFARNISFSKNNLQGINIKQNQINFTPRAIIPPQNNQINHQQGLFPNYPSYAGNYPGFQQYVRKQPLPLQNIGLNPYVQPRYNYKPLFTPLIFSETVYVDHVFPPGLGGFVFPVRGPKTIFGYTRSARFIGNFLHN